jgi:hypothetical protein
MTRPRKQPANKRKHIGADVMTYFDERAKADPEFAAACSEETDKLAETRASWSTADVLDIARTLRR